MDTKQFLNEFGHIANASNGTNKLRELILGLAITGRLIGVDKSNLTASSLVEKIKAHRAELISIGELKRPKPLPEISNQEIPFSIPKNWIFERLGSICDIVRGITFPASRKESVKSDGNVVCLRTANVQAEVDWTNLIYVDPSFVKRKEQWIKSGDTIISMANSYELVGKVSLVKKVEQKATFGGFISAIRPHLLNPEYLYLFLRSPYMQNKMRSTASQTTNIANISLAGLQPIPVPIPPLEEQAKIVSKVNDLMELCDKLDKQQQDKRKLQNQFRQATLQAVSTATSPFELKQHWQRLHTNFSQLFSFPADVKELQKLVVDLTVSGKLLEKPNILNKQNVSDLISRFKNIKSGKRFAKARKPEVPFDIPSGWKWVLLEDLLLGSESGWSPKCHPEPRQKEEWGVLKVSAVTWGVFNHNENKALPSSLEPRPESETYAGDFLLSRANTAELVARSVIVPENAPKKLMMSDKIVRLLFLDDNLKAWVNLANNSSYARDYYYQRATGTSDSMRNVSRQVMHELPIPLPSIEEQNCALEIMDSYFDLCRSLEQKIRKKVNLAEKLAVTAIAKLTGIQATQKEEPLKTPITELVAPVALGLNEPNNKDTAPLATLLAKQDGKMNANDLWQRFGGEIDTFYAQLKTEIKHGWIAEPIKADMLEKDPE